MGEKVDKGTTLMLQNSIYCLLTDYVDCILCIGDFSNRYQDVDTFLFNLKCIAPVQHDNALHPPAPSFS